ncbi:RAD55 family ATPase [[Eubacterium] cellulosolvens]
MFRNTIEGLQNVFDNDIYRSSVILITGPPGCLKSGFTYNIMSKYLTNTNEFGIYMTLEETTESHLRNMKSLRIEIPENLLISDYSDIRSRFEDKEDSPDFMTMIEGVIKFFKNKEGDRFSCFTLDSLGALKTLIDTDNLRSRMFHFFKLLRSYNLISFIILETPRGWDVANSEGGEGFISDGVIEFGSIENPHDVALYMQIIKMKAVSHSRKKHLIEIGEDGLAILGPIFE